MRFNGGFAIHSTLIYKDGTPKDDRVGMELSLGCIRLQPPDINWMSSVVPLNTTIHITDKIGLWPAYFEISRPQSNFLLFSSLPRTKYKENIFIYGKRLHKLWIDVLFMDKTTILCLPYYIAVFKK